MQMSFDFPSPETPSPRAPAPADSNDYHRVPASEKQLRYARQIAQRLRKPLPDAALTDRQKLSDWIDAQKTRPTRFSNYPSSKQVAFAERIARMKRRAVPDECFRDRTLMSRWIDSNL
jgi:hypothetical protein